MQKNATESLIIQQKRTAGISDFGLATQFPELAILRLLGVFCGA